MSIYFYYKRVPASAIEGLGPDEVRDLVPDWCDDECEAERAAGILALNEDCGELVDLLLKTEYDPTSAELGIGALELFEFGATPDFGTDRYVGVLREDDVREVARALDGAPLHEWLDRSRDSLTAVQQELSSNFPFDDDLAQEVLDGAREVAAVFAHAAEAGEVVILVVAA